MDMLNPSILAFVTSLALHLDLFNALPVACATDGLAIALDGPDGRPLLRVGPLAGEFLPVGLALAGEVLPVGLAAITPDGLPEKP